MPPVEPVTHDPARESAPAGLALDGLGWPVRESFVRYVAALPDGRIGTTGGASAEGPFGFVFPLERADLDAAGSGRLAFSGSLAFRGHFGMLALDIAHPTLELADGTGTLSIGEGADRVAIAEIVCDVRVDADRVHWLAQTVLLTSAGAERFGGVYQPGDALAPLAVSVPRGGGR